MTKTEFKKRVTVAKNGCWEWSGKLNNKGYGYLSLNGKTVFAHRVSFELFTGEPVRGICVLHKCDNPKCSNPKHLFLGTQKDNGADMVSKGRHNHGQTHQDAKLTNEDVLYIRKHYKPFCRINGGLSLCRKFGITSGHMHRIIARKNWKHL